MLYAIAAAVGLMSTFYDIAWQSYLPSLVGTSRLHEASSRLTVASSGAQLFGPGLAGFLVRALSAPLTLLADAIGFVVAAISVQTIEATDPLPADRPDEAGVARRVAEGLSYVARHELLCWIAVGTGAWNCVAVASVLATALSKLRLLSDPPEKLRPGAVTLRQA